MLNIAPVYGAIKMNGYAGECNAFAVSTHSCAKIVISVGL